jgi:hypothetical protein
VKRRENTTFCRENLCLDYEKIPLRFGPLRFITNL